MANVVAGRISRSFVDVSGVLMAWSKQATKYWVYEHEEDDEVSRTHVHFLFEGSTDTIKKAKERHTYIALDLDRSDHAYKHKWEISKRDSYGQYMTKGKLDPVFTNDMEQANLWKTKGYDVKDNKVDKKDYYTLCERIKLMSSVEYVVDVKDSFGNVVIEQRKCIRSFDEMYDNLLNVLKENKVRTSEHDLDRWVCTIVRDDPRWGQDLRERLRRKYLPLV